MKIPELTNPQRYTGLYIIDFGDNTAVGYTAEETAMIVESEKFKDVKVYKVHNAHPDGTLDIRGVNKCIFSLEKGMFFYASSEETARWDYTKLVNIAIKSAAPAKAKLQLARTSDDRFVTALIYAAEADEDFSRWLGDNDYKTAGPAAGGVSVVDEYYTTADEILETQQLFDMPLFESRSFEQLLESTKIAVQR